MNDVPETIPETMDALIRTRADLIVSLIRSIIVAEIGVIVGNASEVDKRAKISADGRQQLIDQLSKFAADIRSA